MFFHRKIVLTFLERCRQLYGEFLVSPRILGGSFSETLCLWSPTREVRTCPKCGVAGHVSSKKGTFFWGVKGEGLHSMTKFAFLVKWSWLGRVDLEKRQIQDLWKSCLFGSLIERVRVSKAPKFFAFADFHHFQQIFVDHWFLETFFEIRHPDMVLQ